MTGSSAVIINTAAQAGARAAVGPIDRVQPTGFEQFAVFMMAAGVTYLAWSVVALLGDSDLFRRR